MNLDVIVVGGSIAGMSAALPLVRARRKVLVIDAGRPRNRVAAASHGLLTQDGVAPAALLERGRADLARYPTLQWDDTTVSQIAGRVGSFEVSTEDGRLHRARRLVLAAGVEDRLPDLPGIDALWGRSVFQCPYCHAHELPAGIVGVLGNAPPALQQAALLPDWAPTVFFATPGFRLVERQLALLAARRVTVVDAPLAGIAGGPLRMLLADGRQQPLSGLFVTPITQPAPLAQALGCALDAGATGAWVRTDDSGLTSVPGVYACGDIARPSGSLAMSLASGANAGMAVHRSLMFADSPAG